MTLKARVVLLVVVMLVAGIWALALSVTLALQRDLTEMQSANLSTEVVGVAADIDRDVALYVDVLNRLAASLTPKILADPVKLDRALDDFTDASPIVPDSCFAANSKGIITAGYPGSAISLGTSVEDRDYFRQVMASGKPAIGAPVRAGKTRQPAVPVAVPLRDASGAAIGVLVGNVLLSDPLMLGQIEHTRIGKHGYFLVVLPQDRLILAAPDRSRILQRLPPKGVLPLLDRRLDEGFEGAHVTVTALGVESLGVAGKMATTGWMVLASVPTKDTFAPIEALKRQVYLAALLISLVVAVILRFFLMRQFAPLTEAGRAMRRMTEGELPLAPIPVTRPDEIGELLGNFNQLVMERRQLEGSLRSEIIERKQDEQVRERLMTQLELLSERLAVAQEEERRKIAYELHEELAQELATLKFYLQMMGSGTGAQTNAPHDEALAVAMHATERVRKLVLDLTPPELEDFGLDAAVRAYCQRQAAAGDWHLHIDAPKPGVRAPRELERACFRVLQEGLSNVLRHAKATEVWVHLHQSADELELGIRDNGIGFDRHALRADKKHDGGSLGLFGMQIRAKHVGGSVEIKSTAGVGTEIRAVFPFRI